MNYAGSVEPNQVVRGFMATEHEPLIELRFVRAARPDPIEMALARAGELTRLGHEIRRRETIK